MCLCVYTHTNGYAVLEIDMFYTYVCVDVYASSEAFLEHILNHLFWKVSEPKALRFKPERLQFDSVCQAYDTLNPKP